MLDHIISIITIIVNSFLHVWPYLLLTIPLAVAVNMSGAARYINRALRSKPMTAILLAAIVGAFSPFCSCSVIPVVASLLMGGVPLAPVMTFWIASPSMDPEIFFLSVTMLGWELAVWRLASTLVLSLAAGFITHFIMPRGWLGRQILRSQKVTLQSRWKLISKKATQGWNGLKETLAVLLAQRKVAFASMTPANQTACCVATTAEEYVSSATPAASCDSGCSSSEQTSSGCDCGCSAQPQSFAQRVLSETWKATTMVAKFMALAYFVKALITLYVPSEWISATLGADNPYAIMMAALIGVPVYTSNLTALPMISGLLSQGMNPAAALAFLIAGPTTTLPAMAAVWGITNRRVFALYVSFSLIGALLAGYVYSFVISL